MYEYIIQTRRKGRKCEAKNIAYGIAYENGCWMKSSTENMLGIGFETFEWLIAQIK